MASSSGPSPSPVWTWTDMFSTYRFWALLVFNLFGMFSLFFVYTWIPSLRLEYGFRDVALLYSAMRFGWIASSSQQPHGGAYVTPDHALNHRLLPLAAPDHSAPYQRSDHTRQITLTVGAWP